MCIIILCILYIYFIYTLNIKTTVRKTLWLTYDNLDRIPKYVKDRFKTFGKGLQIIYVDDKKGLQFLKENYGDAYVNRFNAFKKGAHKADLLRYAILYKYGGIYMDIKTVPTKPILECFDLQKKTTILSIMNNTIFQGILVFPQQSPEIKKMLDLCMQTGIDVINKDYLVFTRQAYTILQNRTKNKKLKCGDNIMDDNTTLTLYREHNDTSRCKSRTDRYGYCIYILDKDDNTICMGRDPSFPWRVNSFKTSKW